MLKSPIYILSGLGADERVFKKLDFTNFQVTFIKWEQTIGISLKDYAALHLAQIKESNPILIGLSFGGIIATEIAQQIPIKKAILISSVKNKLELPYYFKWLGNTNLINFIPNYFLTQTNFISNWLFSVKTIDEKQLLKDILNDSNPAYLKWAMQGIMSWRNEISINNAVHIHGSKDRILPYRFVKCNYTIKNGGHFMVYSQYNEVLAILSKELQ